MENGELQVFRESHEASLLKRLFAEKLRCYSGITYDELKNICIMLGINKEGESE